jgi:hypothetical protein
MSMPKIPHKNHLGRYKLVALRKVGVILLSHMPCPSISFRELPFYFRPAYLQSLFSLT